MAPKKSKQEADYSPPGSRRSEVIRPSEPPVRKVLSEQEVVLEEEAESEIRDNVQGRIGRHEYYTAPNPLVYMPRTSNTEALEHDMETEKLINDALSEVKVLQEQMESANTEIDRLKIETRIIIAKLLTA